MSDELVSVIVPAYNAEAFLERCVRSVLAQTYPEIELVIVNDGSADQTLEIGLELKAGDDRITVIDQSNQGLSGARNAGIAAARGSYLLFVDADDQIESDMVENLVEEASRNGSEIVVAGVTMVDVAGDALSTVSHEYAVYDEESYWRNAYQSEGDDSILYIISCGKLVKASLFDGDCFDVGKIHEDEFIIHRLISRANSISFVPNASYLYTSNESSITHTRSAASYRNLAEALCARSDYFLTRGWDDLSARCLATARSGLSKAHLLSADEYSDSSFRTTQRKFKTSFLRNSGYWRINFADWCKSLGFSISPALYMALYERIGGSIN